MNTREKRLLILFGVVIFAVLNFYGYNLYAQKMNSLEQEIGSEGNEILGKPATGLIGEIALAEQNLAERESKEREMAWLGENEPEPQEGGAVQSQLESFVTNQARAAGLTTDRPKIGRFSRSRRRVRRTASIGGSSSSTTLPHSVP